MRYLIFIIVFVISGCGVNQLTPPEKQRFDAFHIKGESYGAASNSTYYVFLENQSFPESLKARLLNYTSYILDYRGMHETSDPNEADYYVIVSFKEYDADSKEQYFQLAAASRKVYEATHEFKPRWWVTSVYNGPVPMHNQMLAMHALSLRDFAGRSFGRRPEYVRYRKNDELVRSIVEKVQR